MSDVNSLKDLQNTEIKLQGDHDHNQLLAALGPSSSFVLI